MNLTDKFVGATVSTMHRGGTVHVHKAGCQDLRNRGLYPERNESRHKPGETGEDMVIEWYDNGILDEAVARELYENPGGDPEAVRDKVMDEYTIDFDIKPCAALLVEKS